MLKAVIIDDETPARNNLKQIINDNFNDVKIIGEADGVESGVIILDNTTPDVLFLDINLPDGNGFKLLEKLENINFAVVFVTAYDSYAIQAFEFNALDYLLKPIEEGKLKNTVEKVKQFQMQQYITREELKIVLENLDANIENKKIALREAGKISFVALKDIIKCEAESSYTTFYLNNNTSIITSKGLKSYQLQLPEEMFFRVHQSCIVNLNYIKEYNKADGGYIILKDGTIVNIARRKKQEFLQRLEQKFF